jgi:hypothetical protein
MNIVKATYRFEECFASTPETGNIHLGSRNELKQVGKHTKSLNRGWLISAAKKVAQAAMDDWQTWRKEYKACARS